MDLALWLVGGFALGVIFGGRVAWQRGRDDKGWLWWKVK